METWLTVQRRFSKNLVTKFGQTARRLFRAIASRKPASRYRDVLGEILSSKSGTRHTDVSGQFCDVNLAQLTQTF